jgi:talin
MEYPQPLSSLMVSLNYLIEIFFVIFVFQDNQQQWPMENRLDVARQLLTSEISTINASIAQIMILTSDINNNQRRNFDYNHSFSTAISTITNNLNEFCKEINVYSNLINDQTNLIDQTHRLCATYNDLLTCIQTLSETNYDSITKQNVLISASRLGEINQDLVRRLTTDLDSSIEYQDKLLSLAKSVANTTAVYVLKAKDIATNIQEQINVNDIISTATQCALATSQLVACTKVVAATITSPLCQEQLIESARSVTRSIEAVLQSCSPPVTIETLFYELTNAGRTVRKSLNEFLLHIKLITDRTAANSERMFSPISNGTPKMLSRRLIANDDIEDEVDGENNEKHYDESIDQIILASDRLFSSVGDATEMVKQAKILAQATAQLVSSLRQQAESADDDTNQQKRFLSAAKMLADATAKMVESAKGCATKPTDNQLQYQLKKAVEELRSATNMATSIQIKRKVFTRVEQCAKHCASCATQCIAATSTLTMNNNKNQQAHQELIQQCKIVADFIPKVVQAIRTCMIKPDSYAFQNNLINACEDFLTPATHLTNLANVVVPTIHDQSQALHLNNSSKQLTQALNDLRTCLNRAQELNNSVVLNIESIGESIELLDRELNDLKRQASDGYLKIKSDEAVI